MEIKKINFFCLVGIIIYCNSIWSQTQKIDRTHLVAATATFAPAILLNKGINSNYLHGFLAYYPQSNISLKGDSYIFLRPSATSNNPLSQNSSLVFGGAFHLKKNGAFDPYIGFQPGISIVAYYPYLNDQIAVFGLIKKEVVPLATFTVGVNYYVSRYFNFFGSIRYIAAKGSQTQEYYTNLNEIRFSFGLGFNFAPNKCETCPSFGTKKK